MRYLTITLFNRKLFIGRERKVSI